MTNSSLLKDNDKAGLAGEPAGATANDTVIKPLECAVTFLASVPKWSARFSGGVRECRRVSARRYEKLASKKLGVKL